MTSGNQHNDSLKIRNYCTYKTFKTVALFYSWICMGLYCEVLGTTLLLIMRQIDSNFEQMGRALTSRAVGLLIGSICGGTLIDRFPNHRTFILAFTLGGISITTFSVPFCSSLIAYSIVLCIVGFFHALHSASGNPMICDLWKSNSLGPLNFIHAGYGFGAALVPLLIQPFTKSIQFSSPEYLNNSLNGTNRPSQSFFNKSVIAITSSPLSDKKSTVNLVGLYLLIASFSVFCSILFILMGLSERRLCKRKPDVVECEETPEFDSEKLLYKGRCQYICLYSHSSCSGFMNPTMLPLLRFPHFPIVLLGIFLYFILVGQDQIFGKFLFAYSTEGPLKISQDCAYILQTLCFTAFSFSRLAVTFLAFRIPVQRIFLGQLIGCMVCTVGLNLVAKSTGFFLVVATLFAGFKSPLFPTVLGVLNRYIAVSGSLVLLVNIGSAGGSMALQYLAAWLIQLNGLVVFRYMFVAMSAILLILGLSLVLIGRRHGERFKEEPEHIPVPTSDADISNKNIEDNIIESCRSVALTIRKYSNDYPTLINET